MPRFDEAYLTAVAARLNEDVLAAAPRKLREALRGREAALQAALHAGVALFLTSATAVKGDPSFSERLDRFLRDPKLGPEVAQLLRGRSLDVEALADLFEQSGPSVTGEGPASVEEPLLAFERAFHLAVSKRPDLAAVLAPPPPGDLPAQSDLVRQVREVLQALQAAPSLLIEAGEIHATNVVSGVQVNNVIFQWAAAPDAAVEKAAVLRRAYLEALSATLRPLSLSGIDPGTMSRTTQLQLDGVYTALLTQRSEQAQRAGRGPGAAEESKLLSALAQLNQHRRLVLLGDPGGGKSTFVNFVALCLAGEALGDAHLNLALLTAPPPWDEGGRAGRELVTAPQPWEHGALLPVRVILRDFAARGLPPAGQPISASCLWAFIESQLAQDALEEYALLLQAHLWDEGGLLLLDGLDEVPEANARRGQIKDAILAFALAFPRCRLLVTSRTYAYQKQEWKLQGYEEALLAPFSRGQIRHFVERWYAHLAARQELNATEAAGRGARLRARIEERPRLRELAERPLLLTLIASLDAWHGGTLPDKREELYHNAVELLLYQWEQQRTVTLPDGRHMQPSLEAFLRVDRGRIRALLNRLAFEAHASQAEQVGTANIPQAQLVQGLWDLTKNSPDVNPQLIGAYLEQRAGLLVPHGVEVYTFPHRTFQEYLAACHLTDFGYPAEVARLAREEPSRWREVTLLAGAKMARGGAWAIWPLVDALCYRSPDAAEADAADAWGALLAGQALAETTDLARIGDADQPKLARVRQWQLRLLRGTTLPPTERALAGNTVAMLGDPRFDPARWYLPSEPLLGFVEVPGGPFTMGSEDDSLSLESETPQHEVELPTFWLARFPVTVAQWRVFVEASRHLATHPLSMEGVATHPVVIVTWDEAVAYCQWLNERLMEEATRRSQLLDGDGYGGPGAATNLSETDLSHRAFWEGLRAGSLRVTLPSEAEWEKAARGTDGRVYPWGNTLDPTRANYDETQLGGTSTVGAFAGGASPYGCEEMAGNVWEWTRSVWGGYPYPSSGPEREARESLAASHNARRVLRGGAFNYNGRAARCAYRSRNHPQFRLRVIGFRVAVSPPTSAL